MLDDYELLYLAKENNEEAINILLKKYSKLIYLKCLKYSHSKRDIDDYINEGIIAFYEAIQIYNENTKFITCFNACLDKRLINYLKLQNRKKHSILNNSIPFDNEKISEHIFADNTNNPEIVLLERENYELSRNKLLKKLNYKEELVFLLKEQNFSNKEISRIIDKNIQVVYKLISKIRGKARCSISN